MSKVRKQKIVYRDNNEYIQVTRNAYNDYVKYVVDNVAVNTLYSFKTFDKKYRYFDLVDLDDFTDGDYTLFAFIRVNKSTQQVEYYVIKLVRDFQGA